MLRYVLGKFRIGTDEHRLFQKIEMALEFIFLAFLPRTSLKNSKDL